MPNNRDNFSETTKQFLANRAGVRCSNPYCRKPTSGANEDPEKITNIGVAAHICAASKGGPRYDAAMTPAERKSPQNGIWLCQSCAKLIDSNPIRYTKELLYRWKAITEARSKIELERNVVFGQEQAEILLQDIVDYSNCWFSQRDDLGTIWGFKSIDERCKLSSGSVVLIAGYSDSNNSMFAQNLVRYNIKTGRKALYFNLKDTNEVVLNKMLAAESYVKYEDIRTGMLTEDSWKRVAYAANIFEQSELILEPYDHDRAMSQYLLSAIKYSNANLIVIDDFAGLGLDENTLSSFMYMLRTFAAKSGTNVFIIVDVANVPKRMDKRPILADPLINQLHKFCDVVLFPYSDDQTNFSSTTELELIIAKNYSLENSYTVPLKALPDFSAIVEVESDSSTKRSIEDRYPGLISGAKLIAEYLKDF